MSRPHRSGLTCIHTDVGLCLRCREDYDEDAQAWIEFGHHAAGIAAWDALQAEIAAEQAREPSAQEQRNDADIPF
jgi:hypothetical protein